ncbi:hypothetical protein [Amycolatopsis mediterranei]|uniref:Basic proline-rich protein n=2 Tax=Amycolatopsis mediterranei TaxID=33910 RepID=A0A9R0NQW2_AMYMS|nr:hypothetical protein [Amycolatopsis mediterranei]AEK38967.1 hypothetical protein RAM_02375 [Amycolatopsis mediterranei S699]KDO09808.1 hypothetical protein DV26_17205 [Amycolatopsis mediterranei]KDU86318.1 hypothetical protein DV36_40360 [Amycolatopsis mediterranei]UZF67462.1 hypothetical protein ISP_000472 [Amycolatopsis mediterranei]
MTDQTGGDQPQKTVAELLAQHGAQVDGGRRRRRRAVDDDDEPATPEAPPGATGSHRRPGVSDTGPQAIIDRVASEGSPPPPAPPARPAGRRRAEPPSPPPPAPRAVPQDSQPLPRPVPPPPARPAPGGAESGQYARPVPPQESGQYARPPQESGQFARPAAPEPAPPRPPESAQLPVPPRAAPRRQPPPQPSQQMPVPPPSQQLPVPPPSAEETRAVPPVRRRPGPPQPSQQMPVPPPQPSQQLPTPPPGGPLSARLDGLNGTPDADIDVPPGPMASGTFAPPPAAPGRPRRAPTRRPEPKREDHTEQFSAVPDDEPPAPPAPKKGKKPEPPEPTSPAGLANWRKRRQKEQMEDTEIGVMPVVPTDAPDDGYPEDDFEPDGFAPQGSGFQAAYDEGPPTGAYPPPMPFAPGDRASRAPVPDDLEPYEREFADDYPADGPDFEQDDYAYEQGEGYEDDEYDDAPEPVAEPEPAASPGKQWLALAGQLAMGVVGGAAVWLGFNWLWVNLPAAALIAALLVVVALVWIVRKIRRAEDLQTTVLAVLVGLVVTVSPAALLLVGR